MNTRNFLMAVCMVTATCVQAAKVEIGIGENARKVDAHTLTAKHVGQLYQDCAFVGRFVHAQELLDKRLKEVQEELKEPSLSNVSWKSYREACKLESSAVDCNALFAKVSQKKALEKEQALLDGALTSAYTGFIALATNVEKNPQHLKFGDPVRLVEEQEMLPAKIMQVVYGEMDKQSALSQKQLESGARFFSKQLDLYNGTAETQDFPPSTMRFASVMVEDMLFPMLKTLRKIQSEAIIGPASNLPQGDTTLDFSLRQMGLSVSAEGEN